MTVSAPITAVQTFVVRYPVQGEFRFLQPGGTGRPTRDTVVVKIVTENGAVGFGQSVPSRTWSYETIETVQSSIDRYLGPALLGADAFDTSTIRRILNRTIANSFSTGQPIAKAGIDLALFDVTGKILAQSAAARWRRTGRQRVTISWTIDVRTLDALEAAVRLAHQRGFRHFNVKVGTDPDFDIELCHALRRLVPDAFLWADANGNYDPDSAFRVAQQLTEAGFAAFEQPFPANRLNWYARLRKQQPLPLVMDEGIVSLVDLVEFHQLGLLDGVAVKVSRCGGLTEAQRILEYMQQNGLFFFASGLTDPDIALAACVLLFAAYDLDRPAALNASQYLHGSILQQPLRMVGDEVVVPSGPGLGITVDEQKLLTGV